MTDLTINIDTPWTIKTPVITRYLDSQYVDDFFKDGNLRISSFKTFRFNNHEERCDPSEGTSSMKINCLNGQISTLTICGSTSYIISATTTESEDFQAKLNVNDGFRILDTVNFARCVATRIPEFSHGYEGICIYRGSQLIEKNDLLHDLTPPAENEDSEKWFRASQHRIAQLSVDSYFLKHIRFSPQAEYRIIWVSRDKQQDYLHIKCPEARQFCERLT
jgi:hypothetical protein